MILPAFFSLSQTGFITLLFLFLLPSHSLCDHIEWKEKKSQFFPSSCLFFVFEREETMHEETSVFFVDVRV